MPIILLNTSDSLNCDNFKKQLHHIELNFKMYFYFYRNLKDTASMSYTCRTREWNGHAKVF